MLSKQIINNNLLEANPTSTATDSLLLVNTWNTIEKSNVDFIKYVNNRNGQSDSLSVEQKCLAIAGKENIELQFSELLTQRNKAVHRYLTEELGVNEANFVVQTADIVNMRTQFEVPIFRIEVSMK